MILQLLKPRNQKKHITEALSKSISSDFTMILITVFNNLALHQALSVLHPPRSASETNLDK